MEIRTTLDMNAPASAAWRVLGERFADVSDWAGPVIESSIDGSLGEGVTRTCVIKDVGPIPGGPITEELTHFDPSSRSLTYVVRSGMPGFMRFAENAWTIEELGGDRCRVTSLSTFTVAWWMWPMSPLMRIQMRGELRSVIKQLAEHVEVGVGTETSLGVTA